MHAFTHVHPTPEQQLGVKMKKEELAATVAI